MSIIAPYGVIPALLIDKSKRAEVVQWIRAYPGPSGFRRGLLRGWAAAVGLTMSTAEYDNAGAGAVSVKPVEVPKEGNR